MEPKLSKAGKMPSPSWSLPAQDTCPGSVDIKGVPVDACKICYATLGNYSYPNVKAVRDHNVEAWQDPEFTNHMVRKIKDNRFFRWFDSGDVYTPELAKKILEIVKRTPDTKHWIPTRSYKVPEIAVYLKQIANEPNAVVRISSDSTLGEIIEVEGFKNSSAITPSLDYVKKQFVCQAFRRDGKCGDCRACWTKEVKTVLYPAHGVKAKKHYREVHSLVV
jgi:hypothetical protein